MMLENSGFIQTYTGSGKNKTTSALGLCFRALGRDWDILITQFMKGDSTTEDNYGELKACSLFKNNITIIQSHSHIPYKLILEHNKTEEDKLLIKQAWLDMLCELNRGKSKDDGSIYKYNMLVLDEVLGALCLGLISQKTFFDFIKQIRLDRPDLEIVLTGRMWVDSIYDRVKDVSNLMTDGRCIKHYSNKHCTTCKRSFEYRSNYCANCGRALVSIMARKGIEY